MGVSSCLSILRLEAHIIGFELGEDDLLCFQRRICYVQSLPVALSRESTSVPSRSHISWCSQTVDNSECLDLVKANPLANFQNESRKELHKLQWAVISHPLAGAQYWQDVSYVRADGVGRSPPVTSPALLMEDFPGSRAFTTGNACRDAWNHSSRAASRLSEKFKNLHKTKRVIIEQRFCCFLGIWD